LTKEARAHEAALKRAMAKEAARKKREEAERKARLAAEKAAMAGAKDAAKRKAEYEAARKANLCMTKQYKAESKTAKQMDKALGLSRAALSKAQGEISKLGKKRKTMNVKIKHSVSAIRDLYTTAQRVANVSKKAKKKAKKEAKKSAKKIRKNESKEWQEEGSEEGRQEGKEKGEKSR